jgi:electron transfer flavoprotein alpha subunit
MDLDYLQALLGEEVTAEPEGDAYQHIWVVAETRDDQCQPVTLELLGGARELADSLGVYVQAVLAGHNVSSLAQELIYGGADTVFVLDDPALSPYQPEVWATALGDLAAERRPEIVLFGATDLGRDLAPRLAQRLDAGLITDCVELSIDASDRLLLATRPLYDGRLLATVACPDRKPQMATVRPGVLQPAFGGDWRTGDVETVALSELPEPRTRVAGAVEALADELPLHRARIVVAGGKALGGPEGVALLNELAELLGATVGADSAAVRPGWLPAERAITTVGGATISPDLYVAFGVDGDVEHQLAAQGARYVVAVHPNSDTPIFKWANLGVVGEPKAVLSALITQMRAAR